MSEVQYRYKMNDEDLKEFAEMFPQLPNFNHHPRQFLHYINLFKYLKTLNAPSICEPIETPTIDVRV